MTTPRLNFGFDAPPVIAGLAVGTIVLASIAVLIASTAGLTSAVAPGVAACTTAASAASFVYTTRRGKFIIWEGLLDGLALRGDETVVDLGCGRGAVLIAAARRLQHGGIVGVDLWRSRDQSGNAMAATMANAVTAGVGSRIELHTGDLRAVPLASDVYDLVVSSLAIHNVAGEAGRHQAVIEAVRLLGPAGRVVLVDLKHVKMYARWLRELQCTDVHERALGWRGWFGGPWIAMRVVTARAPGMSGSWRS